MKIEEIKEHALEHYGTKGMKWGVRKKRKASASSKATSKLRKKKAFELSDDELKKINARLSLEKSYSSFNPSTLTKARNVVLGAAATVAAVKAVAAVITPAAKYAKKIIESRG